MMHATPVPPQHDMPQDPFTESALGTNTTYAKKEPRRSPAVPPIAWLCMGVVLIGVVFFAFQSNPTLHAFLSGVTGESSTSVGSVAENYFGQLSRPLIPETSLYLPLGIQAIISLGIIIAMLTIGWARPQARRMIMLLTVFSVTRQLIWRAVDTMDFQTQSPVVLAVGYGIFAAEVLSFIHLIFGYFQLWNPTHREAPKINTSDASRLPFVDVFVPTYNEPVSVVYRTLVGCIGMEYPNKTVYLCDDKARPEMAQLAEKLGVRYLSRTNNLHAKAGNLNNALKLSRGEYCVIFDADHVPCKKFINEIIGYFQDPEIAFVQTPQHFFTLDPFQRNLMAEQIANNEQDLFYHVIQPGNDHWGAAFFAGSGAMFRRQALNDVGGFATETITEDFHTSIRVQALGWKSAYHPKDLAAGLAQDSYADFVKQRLRWARGMTQVLFYDNPLFKRGLNLVQRICYFTSILYFFNAIHRVVFLTAPLFFLVFGLMTINAGFLEVVVYYLPSFVCLFFGYSVLTYGFRHTFWSEVYESATCIDLLCATVGTILSPKGKVFNVTPKGGTNAQAVFHWQSVWVQIFLTVVSVFGIFMGVFRALTTPSYVGGIFTNLFWTVYNITLLVGAFFVAQERPQLRLNPRIDRRIRCDLRLLDGSIAVGYTTNISENGIAMEFEEPVPVSGTMALKVLDWETNEISFLSVQAVRSVMDEQGKH
ncbi:MAG: glycosyltransferase, partial [Vampirovibrionales bacterium]